MRRTKPLPMPHLAPAPALAPRVGATPRRPRRSLVCLLRAMLLPVAAIALVACGGEVPTESNGANEEAGDVEIGPLKARVRTSQGEFVIDLFAEGAPRTVASFCLLARSGFYDGQEWYGMSPVVRQMGRPIPTFSPGYDLPKEFVPGAWFDRPGRVAATVVSDRPDSPVHGSGFFVTVKEQSRWDLVYPVFGQVIEGIEVLELLRDGEVLESVVIEGDPEPLWNLVGPDVDRWRAAIASIGEVPRPAPR